MTTTSAQSAIAILIDLAQKGEIDPWDVRVIEVIDRFLSTLGPKGEGEFPYQQADLPQSGQAFLWASMLVLLKADTLERLEVEEEEEDFPESDDLDEQDFVRSLPVRLERHIRRRASAPPPRRRRVTLQELIEQIEQIAAELEDGSEIARKRNNRRTSRREAARAIAGLAHNENLTELAAELEKFLMLALSERSLGQSSVDLDQLLEWWTEAGKATQSDHGSTDNPQSQDRVGVFWALLLLSSQSKVELSQEEFYQDLTIKPLCSETIAERT